MYERLPAVPDVPTAQPAQSEGFGGNMSHPENEKPQGAAAELHSQEQGRKREMASCSPPVDQGMVRSTELQELGEAGDDPSAINPDGKTQERATRAEAAGGHTAVTTQDLPLQPAVEMGAGGDTEQGTVKSSSGLHRRPNTRVCRASPLCRWLRKLKAPAEKPKAKPGTATSQE